MIGLGWVVSVVVFECSLICCIERIVAGVVIVVEGLDGVLLLESWVDGRRMSDSAGKCRESCNSVLEGETERGM